MTIRIPITFVGTGRPMRPDINILGINREPSRNGVLRSGIKSQKEFQRMNYGTIPNEELGRGVGKPLKRVASGKRINLEI